MSTPDGPRPRWPLRTIGFVLLQLAAVVAVVGLVTVTTGDGGGPAEDRATAGRGSVEPGDPSARATDRHPGAPGPAASPTGAPGAPPGHPPSAAPTTPSTRITAPPPSPTAAPGVPGPAPGAAGHTTSARDVRVFNNSTIHGLATRAAADFGASGWRVVEVGNYAGGTVPTSTVYYEPGQQAGAQAIADEFGMQVRPRFAGLPGGGPGLVVIVTKDYQSGDTRDHIK